MSSRRIAPATIVGVLVPIRRAKVGGCDHRRWASIVTMFRVHTDYLETLAASVTVFEQRRAQRRRVQAVAAVKQVSVPTCTTCIYVHSCYVTDCMYELYVSSIVIIGQRRPYRSGNLFF